MLNLVKMLEKISERNKVLILERIMQSKGLLFGDSHSDSEKNAEWKKISNYAKYSLDVKGRTFKYFKGNEDKFKSDEKNIYFSSQDHLCTDAKPL